MLMKFSSLNLVRKAWNMFVCWFGVDYIVDLIVFLCDLCETPSIGCRILRDSFVSSIG